MTIELAIKLDLICLIKTYHVSNMASKRRRKQLSSKSIPFLGSSKVKAILSIPLFLIFLSNLIRRTKRFQSLEQAHEPWYPERTYDFNQGPYKIHPMLTQMPNGNCRKIRIKNFNSNKIYLQILS